MHWRQLGVWKESHEFALGIYRVCTKFPKEETFGVISQLRRASTSIPANIVEGHSRKSTREFLQYLYQARASLEEVRYLLLLSKDLNYLQGDKYNNLEHKSEKVSVMLNSLIKSLRNKLKTNRKT